APDSVGRGGRSIWPPPAGTFPLPSRPISLLRLRGPQPPRPRPDTGGGGGGARGAARRRHDRRRRRPGAALGGGGDRGEGGAVPGRGGPSGLGAVRLRRGRRPPAPRAAAARRRGAV